MESKYSSKTQEEIDKVLLKIKNWESYFTITLNHFHEGWSLNLRENSYYPRLIVIFKPYREDYFSIKSFEIHFNAKEGETFEELYFVEKINNLDSLEKELKDIIYGKDLLKLASERLK